MTPLVRLKPPFSQAEANVRGRFYLPRIDGFVYVEDTEENRLHIEALTKVGGYARVDYPRFPSDIWRAIHTLTDALDGAERQTILDVCECILQSFEPIEGDAPVEEPHPAT